MKDVYFDVQAEKDAYMFVVSAVVFFRACR